MTAQRAQRTPLEKVRVLQRELYRAAKANPERTFGVLFDKVCSKEVLWVAWSQVRRNRGAAGVDGETIDAIEAEGAERILTEIREDLLAWRYRPQPVRRVYIPKPDGRQRPLGIPRIRDRIVQAAVRLVIEPLFEASFRPGSYGFRPRRGTRQAIADIRKWVTYGYDRVIDLDLKSYFDTIDHELLMRLVARRVRDPRVLRLIRRWLRAGVMHEGRAEENVIGTPQGGVISPLLANIYLHPLDVFWEREVKATKMVRYADDLVVLCRWKPPGAYLPKLRQFLGRLRLVVNEEKTRVVDAREGFDFLGVHFRKQPTRRDPTRSFCYAWPSRRSMQRIRDRVREAIGRDDRPGLEEKIRRLNPLLRGWGAYFRWLNASLHFRKVDSYVERKLRRWLRRKHKRIGRAFWSTPLTFFEKAGLYTLHGTIAHGS
ncbi:MAG: group II intron reverse transcriptase/maturase [Armatimonadota bacterium]